MTSFAGSEIDHLAHLIAELVVDQRLCAKGPEIHGLIEPDAVVVDVDLGKIRVERKKTIMAT